MITINSITVRLGGRTILDRASAAIPPGGRVGLIGRNGAGKSTLMKVLVGELDPDEGSVEMPRRTRLGYIAQDRGRLNEAEDWYRQALTIFEELGNRPHMAASYHQLGMTAMERGLLATTPTPPSRAAIILTGLGFDEACGRSTASRQEDARRWRRCCSRRPMLLLDEPSNHLDLESTPWRTSSRPIPAR
jgi:ATP-binding cassette subfamily F protein 3